MPVNQKIAQLVERFAAQESAFKRSDYNETQVRREFIDPFFSLLGWDVDNSFAKPEAYKDVIHEARVRVEGSLKAPDYCFRIDGTRKFYVEAKKPSVNIHDDFAPAYQLKRYSWSANLPLGIVTDFQELAIYKTTERPDLNDSAAQARYKYYHFQDYVEKWDEIYSLFSREAVQAGSTEVFGRQKLRGKTTVDKVFLTDIEDWRLKLASNIAQHNQNVSVVDLNTVVQLILDRIIFLRICEDREIEEYERLGKILESDDVYGALIKEFLRAEAKYNSSLFSFTSSKKEADQLTLTLSIDDKVLREIIHNLYFPHSPYEFSVFPVDVLGNVYEQFLGSVIKKTDSHSVTIEQKAEVRKAGGVYYTPKHIVDYIVENTLGKLVQGKSPAKVSKLKVLDPACGSGSFLLGAYGYLLDWHLDYFTKDTKKHKRHIFQVPGTGEWRLTTDTKRQILLNNIYGVDIDDQAIEVTKLSLCLKMLEGETSRSLQTGLDFGHTHQQRILPDLTNNIKHGNSLINWDYCYQDQVDKSDNEVHNIRPFDWQTGFEKVMRTGGFDIVLGNPPWISYYSRQSQLLEEAQRSYYLSTYQTFKGGNSRINTIMLFIERSLDLLKANGLLGFVLDKQIQDVDAYESTRRLLLSNTALQQIVLSVPFPYINLDTNILISQKKLINPNRNTVIVYPRLSPEAKLSKAYTIQQQALLSHERATFTLDQSNPTLTKILNQCHPLKDVARVTTGMCVTAEDFCSNQRQDDTWHEALFGSNVSAYSIIWPSQDQISERAGRGKYICFSKDLVAKVNARFAAAQSKTIKVIGDESRFQQPKIFVRQGPGEVRLIAALDNTDKYYANQTLHIVNKKDPDYSLEFLLGYLNSTIATYVARESGLILYGEKKRPQIRTKALANLPIPVRIEIDTKSKVESFVQKIISAKSNNENEQYKYLVKELDDIFYKLFNLTPQDISHISASRS